MGSRGASRREFVSLGVAYINVDKVRQLWIETLSVGETERVERC